jgi:predicted MPP superfamily phosphohydrolase
MDLADAFVQQRAMHRIALYLISALVLLGIFGLGSAVQDARVVRYTVPVAGLKAPLRIVQLSDSHANWLNMPPVRLERVARLIEAQRPDLVVLSGDYSGSHIVEWPKMRLEKALAPLAAIKAPRGFFAVLGNHDSPYWTKWVFARTPVRLLVADWVDIGPIVLVGTESLAIPPDPYGNFRRAVQRAPTDKPLVALSHEPDFFQHMPTRVQVLIAGHTHGGQIILPFIKRQSTNPFVARHLRGVFHEHGQTLVVSSGLGTSIIPFRIGVPPEIAVITLVPAALPQSPAAAAPQLPPG